MIHCSIDKDENVFNEVPTGEEGEFTHYWRVQDGTTQTNLVHALTLTFTTHSAALYNPYPFAVPKNPTKPKFIIQK